MQPCRLFVGAKLLPVIMHAHIDVGPVVEAGAFEIAIVEREAEWADEVEPGERCGAEPRDCAGVGWNLGRDQHDVQLRKLVRCV